MSRDTYWVQHLHLKLMTKMIDPIKQRVILREMHKKFQDLSFDLAKINGQSLEECQIYVDNLKESTFWLLGKVLDDMVKKDYIKFD